MKLRVTDLTDLTGLPWAYARSLWYRRRCSTFEFRRQDLPRSTTSHVSSRNWWLSHVVTATRGEEIQVLHRGKGHGGIPGCCFGRMSLVNEQGRLNRSFKSAELFHAVSQCLFSSHRNCLEVVVHIIVSDGHWSARLYLFFTRGFLFYAHQTHSPP